MSKHPEEFTGRIIFMSVFNDISKHQTRFDLCQTDFHQEDGHSWDPDQKRSGIPLMNANRKENGTESLN